jgi:PAS domain S-box-containing protein
MANGTSLNVLLVEDRPDDAELLLRELRRAGYDPHWRRVDTEPDYLAALEAGVGPGQPWELVLSDYQMPGFSGVRALNLLQERGSDIPFILVSGTIGEEFAVEAMQGGAADYLLKNRLARLKNAVSHALEENRLRLETRAAERAQRAHEQRFQALIENSADGIGVVGQDGRLSYLSPASLRILGFTPAELLGRDPFDFVHPNDLDRVRAVLKAVQRTPRQPQETEYRLRHADGAWRNIRTTITNLLAEPSVAGVVFNYRDVTAARQDEQLLRVSEGRYRGLFESSPVALWEEDFSLVKQRLDALRDAGHTDLPVYLKEHPEVVAECAALIRVIDINAAAIKLYQANSKDELLNGLGRILDTDEGGTVLQQLSYIAQGNTDFDLEGPFTTLAGARVYISLRWSALPGFEQSLARVMVALTDLSERVRVEQALRASGERYRGLFEGSPVALWEEDFSQVKQRVDALRDEGCDDLPAYFNEHPEVVAECAALIRVIDVNAAALKLYQAADKVELMAGLARIIVEGSKTFAQELVHIAHGDTDYDLEGPFQTITGAGIYLSLRWSSLPGYEHNLSRVIVSVTDITERVRAESELKRRVAELEAINRVSVALRSATTQGEILKRLADESIAILGGSAGSLWLVDETREHVSIAHEHGWSTHPPPFAMGIGIPGIVAATGQPVFSADLRNDARVPEELRANIPAGRSGICVPIRAALEVIGALFVNIDQPRQFAPNDIDLLTTLAEIAGNAIQRTRLHEQTEQQLNRMTALRSVDQAISSSLDLRVTLTVLLDQATTHLAADAADVLLLNPHRQLLEYAVGRGHHGGEAQRLRLRLGQGRAGRVAYERRLVHVADLRAEAGPDPASAMVTAEGFVAYYGVPLLAKGQIKGVLEIYNRQPLEVSQDWLDFLEALAGQAAIAIDNAALFDGLQRSNLELILAYDATIAGWSHALDMRDHETGGHTERVTDQAVRLAAALGMQEDELVHLRRGALLHDIGNMGVPTNILLKPGPLSQEEWASVRQHPQFAFELLSPIAYLRPALDIPYGHHEHWDGTGYPRQLAGEAIPLAARVFAVVDVWDTLLADRPYRRALLRAEALAYLREQSGKHFDPRVVAAFLREVDPEV